MTVVQLQARRRVTWNIFSQLSFYEESVVEATGGEGLSTGGVQEAWGGRGQWGVEVKG